MGLIVAVISRRGLMLDNCLARRGSNISKVVAIKAAGVLFVWVHLKPKVAILLLVHFRPEIRYLRHVSCRLVSCCSALRACMPGRLDQVWACVNVLICLLHLRLKHLLILLLYFRMLVLFLCFPDGFARRADRGGFGRLFERIDLVFFEAVLEVV